MYRSGCGGSVLYMGSVHSKTASVLKAAYVTSKHGIVGLCRTSANEGAPFGVRGNVICPGFVRTPLVEKQIPEQSDLLGITEDAIIQKIMLKDVVDGQFTTTDEIAETAVFLVEQKALALTGQSILVRHGWVME
jgi:3-hydroxybutyrate dehydrogenase